MFYTKKYHLLLHYSLIVLNTKMYSSQIVLVFLFTNIYYHQCYIINKLSTSTHVAKNLNFKLYQTNRKEASDEENLKLVSSIDSCGFLKNINEYGEARMARRAVGVLQKMPAYRMIPQKEHYEAVLWACEKSNSFNLAVSVYEEMKMKSISRSFNCYEALLSVAEKTNHYQESIDFFHSMLNEGFQGTTEVYNICLISLEKLDKPDEALSLLQTMKKNNINRDVTSYTACMKAYENNGDGIKSLNLLEEMIEDGIAYNTQTCNVVLWACVKGGYYLNAIQLFNKMNALRLKMDSNSYNAAIWAMEQSGDSNKAVNLLRSMRIEGIDRQPIAFDGVLSALNNDNNWKEMIEISSWMQLDQVDKSPITYKLLIDALDRNNELQLLGEVYLEALRYGYYSPWIPKTRIMDMRGFPLSLAKIALKTVLLSMIDGKLAIFTINIIIADIDNNNNISGSFDINIFKEYIINLCITKEFPGATHTSKIMKLNDNLLHKLDVIEKLENNNIIFQISRDSLLIWIGDAEKEE